MIEIQRRWIINCSPWEDRFCSSLDEPFDSNQVIYFESISMSCAETEIFCGVELFRKDQFDSDQVWNLNQLERELCQCWLWKYLLNYRSLFLKYCTMSHRSNLRILTPKNGWNLNRPLSLLGAHRWSSKWVHLTLRVRFSRNWGKFLAANDRGQRWAMGQHRQWRGGRESDGPFCWKMALTQSLCVWLTSA
jgi:hypothetical protein